MSEDKEILLGLTTTSGSNWKAKIKEIKRYKIKEVALFPTVLKLKERKELYKLLEATAVERIPHVHLRDDMECWELDYLMERYQTQVFNTHPTKKRPLMFDYSKYAKKIYVENADGIPTKEELERFGGLCLDFSHWEKFSLSRDGKYNKIISELTKSFEIGCCHISAKKNSKYALKRLIQRRGSHFMMDLKELDYMEKYISFLPELISIELENSFAEQFRAKEYLEKIIKNHF